jgi:hypothetical protein
MLWRPVSGWLILAALLFPSTTSIATAAPDESLALIIKLIGDSDREFRAAGLDHVRTGAGGSEGTRLFVARLPELDSEGQAALVRALADRGDSAARPAIVALLAASADEGLRTAAIGALGKLGGPADLPMFITCLSSQTATEQAAAREALRQMRDEKTAQALAAALSSVSPVIKADLIDVLAVRRATGELPAFLVASVDNSAPVRTAAMAALGQLGGAEQLAAMLPGVLKAQAGGERDAAERNVALVCSRIPNEDERSDLLIKALGTVKPDERDQLLSLVGRVGGGKLIDFVGEIATGSDTKRRKLGIDALSKWPDASTADKLLEIANRASDSAERNQAFQGFIKIAGTRDNRNDRQRLDRMKQAMQAARSLEEQLLVIARCRTAYDVETLRFVLPYIDKMPFAETASETIVELAHHREVRDPNKVEFDKALDKVIAASKNTEVVERANRYKRGETWERKAKKAN